MAWVKPLVKPWAGGKFIFSLQSFKFFHIIILGWSHDLTINNLMLDWGNILHRVDSLYTCTQKNSKHLRSHSRATMALDHSRLGLENKFLENKSGRIFCVRQVYFTKSCQQVWGRVNQPFILFIHHIWGETVLFIIQTSDRMRYFTSFQDKVHVLSQYSGRSIVRF